MKITLIKVLFIFIFALAASSTPLPVDQHPQAVTEVLPSELVISPHGEHVYTIDGKQYNVHQVAEEVTHLNLVSEHYLSLSPEKIATAQRVVIESDRLDLLHNPNLNTDYDKVRDGIHIFMGMLLDWFLLPNSRMECDAAVKTLAHNALQTFLDLESKHHYAYDDIRPKGCPPSLTDEKYLQALRGKLKELIAQGPHTLGIEMGTGLQTVSHKGKRRASDSSTSDKGRRTKDFRD